MKVTVMFEVPGKPVAQGRPKSKLIGNKQIMVYDPKKSRDFKEIVRMYCRMAYQMEPLQGALRMRIDVYKEIPKSFSKAKRNEALSGKLRPAVRPDWDNYGKGISDALNGILFVDDGQIVEGTVCKFWSDQPRVTVEVHQI